MKKKAILLVHGMGKNTAPKDGKPGSFGQEFIESTTASLQQFAKHQQDNLENHCDIHEFNYDAWFDKMRTTMADNAKAMADRLAVIAQFPGAGAAEGLVAQLTGFEAKFKNDEFFYTHWLDVIFYGTMLGAKVRVDAARVINQLVEDYGGTNVHIIAHSLGTAVVHDTLDRLYRPGHNPDDQIPDLSTGDHKLGSVWMFANVSRLVNSVTKLANPHQSAVRPGVDGCAVRFRNIHHRLDPFTWLARFNPPNNDSWAAPGYRDIETVDILEANTHSFPQYLGDPKVVEWLLPSLLDHEFKGTPAELNAFAAAHTQRSIQAAYDSLKDAADSPADLGGWMDFLNQAKKFQDAVKQITNNF